MRREDFRPSDRTETNPKELVATVIADVRPGRTEAGMYKHFVHNRALTAWKGSFSVELGYILVLTTSIRGNHPILYVHDQV